MNQQPNVLVAGASGLLGNYLCRHFLQAGYPVTALRNSHPAAIQGCKEKAVDLLNLRQTEDIVTLEKPGTIIHCAGLTNVDECEKNEALAFQLHVEVSRSLARISRKLGSRFVHISTDHLWDGSTAFVSESTPVTPINAYGRTKAQGEQSVLNENPDSLIIRTNFYGPGLPWRQSFSDWIIHALKSKLTINLFTDVFYTPLALPHLAASLLMLLEKNARGIYHAAGSERISKHDFAMTLATSLNLPREYIRPRTVASMHLGAARPRDMSLSVAKIEDFLGQKMPDTKSGIMTLSA